MGRPKLYDERCLARFAGGTFARIDAVLSEREDRAALIRDAVEREIERREAMRKRPRSPAPPIRRKGL